MKQVSSGRKYFAAVAAVTAFMIFAVPLMAQQSDLAAGRMAGSMAARANTSGAAWFAIGFFCTCLGVGAAYVLEPNPPTMELLGKSPEYVAAYTDSYKQTAKSERTGKAWTGCIVAALVDVALGVANAAL